jgi:hypothetical protein
MITAQKLVYFLVRSPFSDMMPLRSAAPQEKEFCRKESADAFFILLKAISLIQNRLPVHRDSDVCRSPHDEHQPKKVPFHTSNKSRTPTTVDIHRSTTTTWPTDDE